MKWFDHHNPNHATTKRTKPRFETTPPEYTDAQKQLQAVIAKAVTPYNVAELIRETPACVRWLRDRMMAGSDSPENGSKSAAPMRLSYMCAADREVLAIAYWCKLYGIKPSCRDGLWVRRGLIYGVTDSESPALEDMVGELAARMDTTPYSAVADDSVFGVWTIRRQHYRNWPELSAYFASTRPEVESLELETLF